MKVFITWAILLTITPCLAYAEQASSPFYAGVHAGIQRYSFDDSGFDDEDTSIAGGIHVGIGKEHDNGLYTAIEVEGNLGDAKASETVSDCTGKSRRENYYGAHALLGKAMATGRFYLKAGAIRAKFKLSLAGSGCSIAGKDSETKTGTSFGLGYSHSLTGLWALRGEVSHVKYSSNFGDDSGLRLGLTRRF